MNTTTRTPAEQAKLDKRAKAARDKRAAAKAAQAMPVPWRLVEVDGKSVKVDASLSSEEADKLARQLLGAKADVAAVKAAEAPEAPKTPKPVKLKGDPLATVFYRLSKTAMEALEGKPGAEYRAANPADWKILKASKKITGGQSFAFTGNLRPEAAKTLAAALRSIAGTEGFAKPGSLITNAAKLESNHYVTKAAAKR